MSNRRTLVVTAVMALGVLAFTANAEDVLPARGPIPFSVYDQDGNGLVNEAEFNAVRAERMAQRAAEGKPMRNAANAPAFADFDANGDGNLTNEELLAGQQRQMGQRGMGQGMGQGIGKGPGQGNCMNMPTFADIDSDGSGAISPDEFAAHQQQRHGQ
jgi:hypothetical protein